MNSIQNLEHSRSDQAETIITKTTCPYCGVGCGVDVNVQHKAHGTMVKVAGDIDHPSNFGRLCIKGSNLADTLGLETRVLEPMLGRNNHRQVTTWEAAIEKIATQFQHCIDQYGRDSIAFYVSGQLLTEDYYVVNKFVKGYLGTANIDTNSRLCMSSAVAAHKRAFGEDIVPASYEDFEHTDMVVLVGSNTAWCHPVLYQRIMQAKSKNPDLFVVVVDPRFTSTCEQADLHLPILPGQDVALFNGLFQHLYQNNHVDNEFVEKHAEGLEALLAASESEQDIHELVKRTGISAEKLQLFFDKFAQTEKVMTLFSMGVNQSSQGVNKANSIINCHLLTGKIGKLGAAPFSMTGQPNAMGGREVGGLANMLAAHLDIDNPSHQSLVQSFWKSPTIATQTGLKAVDLFQAIESGKIKAVWIMATNPVVSLPDADQVKRALDNCEFVVISDICAQTDTTAYADVLLPALGWGEKDGTVTNSERRISRQRAFLAPPKQAKADWWAVCEVAKKLGFNGFDFSNACDIFNEHAALSAYQNASIEQRDQVEHFRYFNLKGLMNLSVDEYNHLRPIQWPVWEKSQGIAVEQLFDRGDFSHKNKKAKLIATLAIDPVHTISEDYPLILNTGRIRDQWHTMTRTGLSANLTTHRAEPFCEIHPNDALKFGIQDKALVEVRSEWGSCVLRVTLDQGVRRGQIFAPIHWTEQVASDARIGKVVNPVVDAISGEPEFKHTPVAIQTFHTTWQGVLYVREGVEQHIQTSLQQCAWWAKIKTAKAFRYEIAARQSFDQTQNNLKNFLPFIDETYEWLSLEDRSSQLSHSVILQDGILIASLYIAPADLLPDRDWVAGLFKRERLSALHRKALLAGTPISATNSDGPLVCSCFKVGKNKIIEAIKTQNITHEKQVTACLKAGGNCGSCLPEIRGLIKSCQQEAEI
ncbi:MAG TPA: nitrate reductase [Acinetobacter ursingii]|uniref:nitrate reductase n=1 Tax=Acinetobacter ursingii TaxID=108980 RepID=UPI0006681BC0|nr:nitrate reductase [Acinetobacter ursingii]MCH2005111.1 molybdopterin-dependent oxidoreductase [Acinetobacter ursingii]MCU4304570.1 molybdopterin-dependent oxidoreductase [Acinetobacter ursingii]MCU4370575.1 molybdopterin-dependent oxidoreductase [Acinetobacter ursingii]MCU4380176.1 molybdopterin-dependent oxidoreductase [Acinetobacter ursingii]MCU4609189.1 molybdopterin-dependent oxidoreductase [Acinetobacter ursingii]